MYACVRGREAKKILFSGKGAKSYDRQLVFGRFSPYVSIREVREGEKREGLG